MKLRILDDSIRLRLSQSEVERIAQGEAVHSHTRFLDGFFLSYGLEPSAATEIGATFLDNVITVRVPAEPARTWATTDQVTLIASQPFEGGELAILVEKDFECLEPRAGAEDRDSFPNPKGG
jgi:hypothetical protein